MTEGLVQYLTYRVVDQNTGTELINPLPHPHESAWTVMALQQGLGGTGTLGQFSIPLYGPQTEQYRAALTQYNLLSFGQKIEGYIGNVAQGTPKFSGVITGLQKTATSFVIQGYDTLWWLKMSPFIPGETLVSTNTGDTILSSFKGTWEILRTDDFSGGSTNLTSNYTQTPAAQWTATTDPNFGLSAIQCSTVSPSTRAFVIANATATAAQWQISRTSAIGTIVAGTDTSDAGELCVVVESDSTGANCVFGRAIMRQTSATWAVDAEIWQNVAGTLTLKAQVQNIFTGLLTKTFRCEVTMHGTLSAGATLLWTLLINGQSGTSWDSGAAGISSRSPGFTHLPASAGSPTVYIDRLSWTYRNNTTPRFNAGSVTVGTRTLQQSVVGNNQAQLDMWVLAMGLDGFFIRKNPIGGSKGDTYDFAVSPGTDRSGQIRFVEGVNVENVEVTAASELYATDVRMTALPGGDSGGAVTWSRIGSAGDMVLTDTVADVSTPSFTLLVLSAKYLQAIKVSPWAAKTLSVLRDPQTADQWRELDYVTLHYPSLNINNLKVLVLGYTWAEGSASQTVYLDQYAGVVSGIALQRLHRTLQALSNTYKQR